MDAENEPQLINSYDGHTESWTIVRDGKKIMIFVPAIQDHLPEDLKNALDRMRRSLIYGTCDCGGQMVQFPTRADGANAAFKHSIMCPAEDRNITRTAKLHGWSWSPPR